jgi:cupin fold WbuC family metalloprotein
VYIISNCEIKEKDCIFLKYLKYSNYFYNQNNNEQMKIVTTALLKKLSEQAMQSPRKRTMFCLHETDKDTLHRMCNVLQPGTYMQPHKHISMQKREVFVLIQGEMLVCLFDDDGNVTECIELSRESGNFVIEIPPDVFHTIISLQVNSVVFECKDGPYNAETDKLFATWSPSESEANAYLFTKNLLAQLGYAFPDLL